jgi:plastocyanin
MSRAAPPLAAALSVIVLALAAGVSSGADNVGHAAVKRVTVGDNFFSPTSVSIRRGTTVKWTWSNTSNRHNVKVRSGPRKFSSSTKRSGTYSRKISTAGTYKIYCSIHPSNMKMTIRAK